MPGRNETETKRPSTTDSCFPRLWVRTCRMTRGSAQLRPVRRTWHRCRTRRPGPSSARRRWTRRQRDRRARHTARRAGPRWRGGHRRRSAYPSRAVTAFCGSAVRHVSWTVTFSRLGPALTMPMSFLCVLNGFARRTTEDNIVHLDDERYTRSGTLTVIDVPAVTRDRVAGHGVRVRARADSSSRGRRGIRPRHGVVSDPGGYRPPRSGLFR